MTTLGFGDSMGVPESLREVGIDKQPEEDRLAVVCCFSTAAVCLLCAFERARRSVPTT